MVALTADCGAEACAPLSQPGYLALAPCVTCATCFPLALKIHMSMPCPPALALKASAAPSGDLAGFSASAPLNGVIAQQHCAIAFAIPQPQLAPRDWG